MTNVTDTLVLIVDGQKFTVQRQAEKVALGKRGKKKQWNCSSLTREKSFFLNATIPSLLEEGEQFNCSLGRATVYSIDDQSNQCTF